MAAGYDVVAIRVFVDRIDVEKVKAIVGSPPRANQMLAWADICVPGIDIITGAPLKDLGIGPVRRDFREQTSLGVESSVATTVIVVDVLSECDIACH